MMIDQNIVFVSPGTVYNALNRAGLMGRRLSKPSKKGTGFEQPEAAHKHWHVDISYINLLGTFYYLCSILDGFSRFLLHWVLKEAMKETDVEFAIEEAREKFPGVYPRIISDNGPQFIAKEFKEYIRLGGMTHVRTAPYYPQSNGKIERWHGTLKRECIRPKVLVSPQDAVSEIKNFVDTYNNVRLHSSIGYVTPKDKLEGRAEEIIRQRQTKLNQAREFRRKIFMETKQLNAGGAITAERPYTNNA